MCDMRHFQDYEAQFQGLQPEVLFEKYIAPNNLLCGIVENREWFIDNWLLIISFSVEELQTISSKQPSQQW